VSSVEEKKIIVLLQRVPKKTKELMLGLWIPRRSPSKLNINFKKQEGFEL